MGKPDILRKFALLNVVVPLLLIINIIAIEVLRARNPSGFSDTLLTINVLAGLLFILSNAILATYVFARKKKEVYALAIYSVILSLSTFLALQFSAAFIFLQFASYFLLFFIGLYYLWKK